MKGCMWPLTYGRLLYQEAKRKNCINDTKAYLESLIQAVNENIAVVDFFSSYYVSSIQKKECLYVMFPDSEYLFLREICCHIIIKLKKIKHLDLLYNGFILTQNQEEDILECEHVYPFDDTDDDKIQSKIWLQKHYPLKTIKLKYKKEPNLISGFLLKSGSSVLDYSVKNRIEYMQKTLVANIRSAECH